LTFISALNRFDSTRIPVRLPTTCQQRLHQHLHRRHRLRRLCRDCRRDSIRRIVRRQLLWPHILPTRRPWIPRGGCARTCSSGSQVFTLHRPVNPKSKGRGTGSFSRWPRRATPMGCACTVRVSLQRPALRTELPKETPRRLHVDPREIGLVLFSLLSPHAFHTLSNIRQA
jgi:hypothetical protein